MRRLSLLGIITFGVVAPTAVVMAELRREQVAGAPDIDPTFRLIAQSPTTNDDVKNGEPSKEGESKGKDGFWIFDRPAVSGSLSTDRPGFSDSYALVPRGYSHLEWGYSFYYDKEHNIRSKNHALGEFSFRTGLTDWFELRVKWSGYSFTETLAPAESRFAGRHIMAEDHDDHGGDMSLGFKAPLLKQDGFIPNLSIIPAISLPTGAPSKSSHDVDPEVRLAWNYALSDKWQVYGVGLATYLSDDGPHRFFQAGASLATVYTFNEHLSWFVEYYGLYPSNRHGDCQHNIDFGPVILVNNDFQIDIRAGFGLNEEAPDFQAGIGFSYRF